MTFHLFSGEISLIFFSFFFFEERTQENSRINFIVINKNYVYDEGLSILLLFALFHHQRKSTLPIKSIFLTEGCRKDDTDLQILSIDVIF